jgi:hypothetical protein
MHFGKGDVRKQPRQPQFFRQIISAGGAAMPSIGAPAQVKQHHAPMPRLIKILLA